MLAADFTQSIKGPSEVVDGIWDRDQIKNLPACVLEDINISDDPDQRALSSLPVPLNTSWLRAEDLASLDQYRQRQDEELEGTNVLFKMSAVGQPRIAQKRKKMRLAAPTNDTELRVVTKERSADEAYWSWNGACVPSDLHKATSSVRNDQKRGVRLVEQLQRGLHMHGDFESSFVTQDTYDPLSGMIQSRSSSSVITRGTVLTGRTRSLFCHLGANLYYANVLWVTTDQTLVYSVEKALYDSASSATHGAFCTCSIDDEDCYD